MSTGFQVGDRVRIPLGRRKITGTIVEDRGTIGVRGRHLYQVLVPMDPFEPTAYELPEDEIEAIEADSDSGAHLDRIKIIDYLKNGGLISILRSNLSGGRSQPKVWLCLNSLGDITHTFNEERGRIGGESVPFLAIHEDHVFAPKRNEVLTFLRSFGLERVEAEDVVSAVGTSPP